MKRVVPTNRGKRTGRFSHKLSIVQNVRMIKIFKIIIVILLIAFAFYLSISKEFEAREQEAFIRDRKDKIKKEKLDEPVGLPDYFPGNSRKIGYGGAFFSILVAGILLYSLKRNNYFNKQTSDK